MDVTGVIIGLLLAAVIHLALRLEFLRAEAREDLIAAYNAIAGLNEVAKEAYAISQFDHRTMDSLRGSSGSFLNEKNATARYAKYRGFEVWRNSQVDPMQGRLRAGYRKYETNTQHLVQRVQDLR